MSVEKALVKNVQQEMETEEPYFTENKSEISLQPAQPGVYTSHDLKAKEVKAEEQEEEFEMDKAHEDSRAMKHASTDDNRF